MAPIYGHTGVAWKRSEQQQPLAFRANTLSVRVAASPVDAEQFVEEIVISRVLADHQWRVVAFRPVQMMHLLNTMQPEPEKLNSRDALHLVWSR